MKLIIDIPSEFVPHFMLDSFEDSLNRIKYDIIDKVNNGVSLSGKYEIETIEMFIKAFVHAKIKEC